MSEIAGANGFAHSEPPVQETVTSTPPTGAPAPSPRADGEFDATSALLRLLVGATLEGAGELRSRLRLWDETVRASSPTPLPADTTSDLLRYAAVGMVFETQRRVRRNLSTLARLSGAAARGVFLAFTPALQREPLDSVMRRVDDLLFQWMVMVDRWIAVGGLEESEARVMARKALPGVIDEVLDLFTKNPEVRELVTRQGTSLANTAVEEVRERADSADLMAERLVHGLLRRSGGARSSQSSQSSARPRKGSPKGQNGSS